MKTNGIKNAKDAKKVGLLNMLAIKIKIRLIMVRWEA